VDKFNQVLHLKKCKLCRDAADAGCFISPTCCAAVAVAGLGLGGSICCVGAVVADDDGEVT
jgi:hypothetical protein